MCGIKQLINVILYLVLFLINIKLKKICDIVVSLYPFLIVHYPDKYKTQKMCDEAVDDYLAALKSISDWFFTRKILEKFDNNFHANDDTLFHNEDFDKVTHIANQKHIIVADLEKLILIIILMRMNLILLVISEF